MSPRRETKPHGTYVITFDLGEKIKCFRQVGLKTPDSNDPFFTEFQSALTQMIVSALPNMEIKAINMTDLADKILATALHKTAALHNATVVSSCLEIAAPRRGHTLEINRIVDFTGKIVGLGPRPGHITIDEQIDALIALANYQPLVLVEDGTFTGETMCYIIEELTKKDVSIASIIIGIAFPKALKRIKAVFDGEIIIIERLNNLIDWMPDHDFVPFAPNCGRVFGISMHNKAYPFYTYNGASYSIPYTLPFCNQMSQWTNLPQEMNYDISHFCLDKTIELFERIEKINGGLVRIGDLTNIRPAVSIPIAIGQSKFPNLNTSITDFLYEAMQNLQMKNW